MNPLANKLSEDEKVKFHHLVAKLLYLAKRTRPDLLPATAFLCTRVQAPDEDDYKKLGRCMRYLQLNPNVGLTLEANDLCNLKWWIDASYGVHHDMKSHTGAVSMAGKGAIYAMSSKQKLNTRSSTEAELVGVNDAMSMVLWVRKFIEAQGYTVKDNVIFQDNMSAMLLEKNGKCSSGKKTRHIDIRYYFITDNINHGTVRV